MMMDGHGNVGFFYNFASDVVFFLFLHPFLFSYKISCNRRRTMDGWLVGMARDRMMDFD
jgi:hypothetical protein